VNRLVLSAFTTLAGLAIVDNAHATLITFDSVTSTETIRTYLAIDGYEFSSDHFHTYGASPYYDGTAWNGTTHIGYEPGRGDAIEMRRLDGAAFSLLALDVSEFYNVPTRPNANILEITGSLFVGGTVSHQVLLDAIFDGRWGLADFQSVQLPSVFTDVTSVLFTGLLFDGAPGGVALDNLAVSVPEPGTLLLLGAGLLMLGCLRVKRVSLPCEPVHASRQRSSESIPAH
jgi:hypothetical protein